MMCGTPEASRAPSTAATLAAAPARACTRCRGTGFRDTPRAHWGVPGLCFDCDGDGRRLTQIATWSRQAEEKAKEAKRRAAMAPIEAIRAEHGTIGCLPGRRLRGGPDDRHTWSKTRDTFTTLEYAAAFGLTPRTAFIELARTTTISVVFDDATAAPLAWSGSR